MTCPKTVVPMTATMATPSNRSLVRCGEDNKARPMISFGGHDKARIFQPLAIGRFPTEPIALSTPTKTSALLGPWLVWRHHASEGPEIKVHFVSAEGLIA